MDGQIRARSRAGHFPHCVWQSLVEQFDYRCFGPPPGILHRIEGVDMPLDLLRTPLPPIPGRDPEPKPDPEPQPGSEPDLVPPRNPEPAPGPDIITPEPEPA